MLSNLLVYQNKSKDYLTFYARISLVGEELTREASLLHLKPAGRCWSADAVFFHGRANYFGEQRFPQQTCFGMIRRSGSNWTAVADDEVLPIFFMKSGRAPQFFENVECSINSFLACFAAQLAQMFFSHASAGGTHSGTQVSRLNLPGEY